MKNKNKPLKRTVAENKVFNKQGNKFKYYLKRAQSA